MLDTDEIKAKFEELYDEVCSKVKKTEETDDQIEWQEVELHLHHALEALDAIKSPKRELGPDSELLIAVERE